MTRSRFHLPALAVAAVALVVAACGGGNDSTTSGATSAAAPAATSAPAESTAAAAPDANVSGDISFAGVWTGDEQKNFQAVLDGFKEKFPNVTVKYNPAGDQLPTVLATAVAGGKPPDMAAVAQPGLMRDFAGQGELKPIDYAKDAIAADFGQSWIDLGTVDDQLYGLTFKAANKSTVWYNVPAFTDAGVQPPKTWDELLTAAGTLQASGLPAYSIGGADGWTLTDLFENIYLRQAGPDMYDKLSTHAIPWTDQTVKDALTSMAKVVGDPQNIAGGTSGALAGRLPDVRRRRSSATRRRPRWCSRATSSAASSPRRRRPQPKTGFDVFGFPSINNSPPAVVGGGDTVITFNDTPAVQALVAYLATPEAASIWAAKGGFSSANKKVDPSVYPDDITRATASALADAETFRFDMSDLAPAAFGGTVGQGEWKDMQDFVKSPDDVDGAATKLEADAAKAFGS